MKEMERRRRKKEKAERKEARRAARVARQRLLDAMFVMAHNYQVHPVYPSDTDELEWRDPTPVSDREFPRSPEDQWNEVYYNE
jgi:hypothetical protein